MLLCHDITEIIPGREKRRAFRRGHVIRNEDIPRLRDLGKEHIYVWEPEPDLIHEDEAALRLARHAAGPGLLWDEPNQGKVNLKAACDGLLKIRGDRLMALNDLDDIVFATLHNNRVVSKDQIVAGTRITPLTIHRSILEEAEKICRQPAPLLEVKPFQPLWVGMVTNGREVYEGRIKDGFCNVVRQKTTPLGGRLLSQVIVPDDPGIIAMEIRRLIELRSFSDRRTVPMSAFLFFCG